MISLRDLNEGIKDCGVLLICPICGSELMLENPYRKNGRVQKGEIHCLKGCAVFPIIDGVPIISASEKSSVTDKQLRRIRRLMGKDRWQKSIYEGYTTIATKGDNTSSRDSDAVAISERLRRVENGVVIDIGCGGGFTTERVLQSIQPSVYSVSLDIFFGDAKLANKRAELLGMSDRSMGICADALHLPFVDYSFSAAYTRYGFNHIKGYVDALKEVYRTLKNEGALVVTEGKNSMWIKILAQEFAQRGLNYEEQIKELRNQGYFTNIQDFIENVKQVGFDITSIDDASYVLVEAIKR
jgi:ubiquinone/menaquinone biosynthesis C-methylase UbiE/uncharacterized protein YbaR (Trm112 family)